MIAADGVNIALCAVIVVQTLLLHLRRENCEERCRAKVNDAMRLYSSIINRCFEDLKNKMQQDDEAS